MAEVHGVPIWPGVVSPASFYYTLSHGISPGVAILTTLPQDSAPAMVGTLVFTDGVHGAVSLPDCKVSKITSRRSGNGTVWTLEIYDRRWKWNTGQITGTYNQIDRNNKLLPWCVRSPEELAVLCLQAMGETGYTIDLPGGLTKQDGLDFIARLGLNSDIGGLTQQFGTNTVINWEQENPAVALASLCEQFGRRVIYRWSTNSVLIARPGIGLTLPTDGSIATDSPAIDVPERPDGVAAVGSPTRFQVELLLEPVGEEWNGRYRELDALSYTPQGQNLPQIVVLEIAKPVAGEEFRVYLSDDSTNDPIDGTFVAVNVTGETPSEVARLLVDAINAVTDPKVVNKFTVSRKANQITLTGNNPGEIWQVYGEVTPRGQGGAINTIVKQHADRTRWWLRADQPNFGLVRETDRLSLIRAQQLAQKSIFRCYRIAEVMLDGRPLEVPGYGVIKRRQQLVLTDHQVEHVTPDEQDTTIRDQRGQSLIVNLYSGFARDRPAAVFGSIAKGIEAPYGKNRIDADGRRPNTSRTRQTQTNGQPNDPELTQIHVPFHIDPENQLVVFERPVYQVQNPGYIRPCRGLILRTSVLIRNHENNGLECYAKTLSFPNKTGTNFFFRKFPDIQLEVIGKYDAVTGTIHSVTTLDNDANKRSTYYVNAMAIQYIDVAAQTIEYNGLRPIDVDGAIQQVTWTISDGCMTEASRNTEHSIYVAPYPVRRRDEYLAPVARQAPTSVSPPVFGVLLDMSTNTPFHFNWVRNR